MGSSESSSSSFSNSNVIRIVNSSDHLGSDIICKLSYYTILQANPVGKNAGLNHAFLVLQFSDGSYVRAEIGKGNDSNNMAAYLVDFNRNEHLLNGRSYNVIDGQVRWGNFLDQVTIFRRDRPRYRLLSNNCYDFVDFMLRTFAVNYEGECAQDDRLQQGVVAAGIALDVAALVAIGLGACIH